MSYSSRASYKFYYSQYLWKKGDLKESYDNALESVKLHLAKLQQLGKAECIHSITSAENESKTLNLAGTQIKV